MWALITLTEGIGEVTLCTISYNAEGACVQRGDAAVFVLPHREEWTDLSLLLLLLEEDKYLISCGFHFLSSPKRWMKTGFPLRDAGSVLL